jgi:hypothetical protein
MKNTTKCPACGTGHDVNADLTQARAWAAVLQAATCLEVSHLNSHGPRSDWLRVMAGELRDRAEELIGPQPGFGPKKTIPKPERRSMAAGAPGCVRRG